MTNETIPQNTVPTLIPTPAASPTASTASPTQRLLSADYRWIRGKDGKLYFSVVDVLAKLLEKDPIDASKYWHDQKKRMAKDEGFQFSEKIRKLKLSGRDGKKYMTDVADLETIFRIIESVPSPKAEPIKAELAKLGAEEVEKRANGQKDVNSHRRRWKARGHDDRWIRARETGIIHRNAMTAELKAHGIENEFDYANLTNILYKSWYDGKTAKKIKNFKGLQKNDNLRDHMTQAELLTTDASENAAWLIAAERESSGYAEMKTVMEEAGDFALTVRQALEKKLGHTILSPSNCLTEKQKIARGIEAKTQESIEK